MFWQILANYLLNRKSFISLKNYSSNEFDCNVGLPQGSVIAPLLFTFYISDMLTEVPSHMSRIVSDDTGQYKFADDLSLLVVSDNPWKSIHSGQLTCDKISIWCNKWQLKVNTNQGKSEAILHFQTDALNNIPNFIIQGRSIQFVDKSPVLGLWIDKFLTFKYHASSILNRCYIRWKEIASYTSKYKGLKQNT